MARSPHKRTQSDAAMFESEQRLRAIVDSAEDAIITIDDRGIVESLNASTERMFGFKPDELIGQNINRLMPAPFHAEHDGYLRNFRRTGIAKIIGIGREVTGLRKDGTTFPMHLSVSEIRLGERRMFTGIVHDLSERRRLERQILEAATNEQRRIGQDLHDGLCQDLIGIAFAMETIRRGLPPGAEASDDALARLAASVRSAAGQARDLSHGLNPVDLKAGGLPAALENLSKKVAESFGVACTFQWDPRAVVLQDATATHLYRLAQEAVSNAIKHGKARAIDIRLTARDKFLSLSVSDNGVGMPEEIANRVKQGLVISSRAAADLPGFGMGLQTMHYRARVIGGSFTAMPRKGGGTVVTCMIGCEPTEKDVAKKLNRT